MTEMDIITALAVIEDAVTRSQAENVNTPEVLAALDFLEAKADAGWPFEQFRKVLAPERASLIWIKSVGVRCNMVKNIRIAICYKWAYDEAKTLSKSEI